MTGKSSRNMPRNKNCVNRRIVSGAFCLHFFNKRLRIQHLKSSSLTDSRNNLKRTICDQIIHFHSNKSLMKIDAVNEHFTARKIKFGGQVAQLAADTTAAETEIRSAIKQLAAINVRRQW